MKKDKKNYWKIAFIILTVLNIIVFCYGMILYLVPPSSPYSQIRCSQAVNCTQCNKGKRKCQYYDDNMVLAKDTIQCDCVEKFEVQNEEK